MKKLLILLMACAATIIAVYFLSTIMRPADKAINDTPISDTFGWMEEVHQNNE